MKKRVQKFFVFALALVTLGTMLSVFLKAKANDYEGHWSAQYIEKAKERGWMEGYPDGSFQPDKSITRAEFSTMLWRALEKPEPIGGNYFTDVKSSDWYYNAVNSLYEKSIVQGYGDRKFGPNDTLTREMGFTMLARAFDLSPDNENTYKKFGDYQDVSSWAQSATSALIEKGYVEGIGNNKLVPKKALTRGEMAKLLITVFDGEQRDVLFIEDDMYITEPDMSNITTDEQTGIMFVNNELVIEAKAGAVLSNITELCKLKNAKIIGMIIVTNTYQIRLDSTYTYDELKKLAEEFETYEFIDWVDINLVFEEDLDYYPNDPEWENEWDEIAQGSNWGGEAIKAPLAWDFRDDMEYVNVGIYDCCFYSHNDLVYSNTFNFNSTTCESSHGTHVTGIIGAGFNNSVGISGVCPKTNLYGVSSSRFLNDSSYTLKYKFAFTILIEQNECKVLNFSQNTGRLIGFSASHGNQKSINWINECANQIGRYLEKLINNGNDFVICVAAGNNNTIRYVVDPNSNNGYRTLTQNDNPNDLEIVSGGALAEYNNFLNSITNRTVKDRIIVVGSAKNEGNNEYSYSDFSNIGDRVDIVAPGEAIYSTVSDNGYDYSSGTSMSTPHVSGVVAMIWGVNPNLTGAEVKKIVVDNADINVNNCDYNMVNAYTAVKNAMGNTTEFPGGDGTEENPYQVSTAEQLDAVRNDLSAHYIQVNDIDLSSYENWIPIGGTSGFDDQTYAFRGSYDGQRYVIRNMNIVAKGYSDLQTYGEIESYCIGLFGAAHDGARIKNVIMENAKIDIDLPMPSSEYFTGSTFGVGGIVGYALWYDVKVENCKVNGSITFNNTQGLKTSCGGIVGYGGIISNCENNTNITLTSDSAQAGGITSLGSVSFSINNGNIEVIATNSSFAWAGGITADTSKIDYCINYGDISATVNKFGAYSYSGFTVSSGGIAGNSSGTISNSINYGNVTAIGNDANDSGYYTSGAGGIVGYSGYYGYEQYVNNCYNFGASIVATKKATNMYEEIIIIDSPYTGRISGGKGYDGYTLFTNVYSLNTTLVNNKIPTENIGGNQINGISMTRTEIEQAIQYILAELNL